LRKMGEEKKRGITVPAQEKKQAIENGRPYGGFAPSVDGLRGDLLDAAARKRRGGQS